jgi:hypothetical protein
MTDPQEQPRDAHDLADRVSELGTTTEDALEEVASRNASLQKRLPDEDSGGAERDRKPDDPPRGEGAPGQG